MKKLILCGSALLLSLGFANAQVPGITATSAYDDFQDADAGTAGVQGYGGPNGEVLNWWMGTRGSGELSVPITAGAKYVGVDFGNNGSKLFLNLSTMADIEVVVENEAATPVSVRLVLEDVNGKQTQIEPNISDVTAAPDFAYTIPGVSVPENEPGTTGGVVYPKKAYNGFILKGNDTKTVRIDLSSVAGAVGGLKYVSDGNTTPSNSPTTTYDFDPSKVHAILFIINEGTNFTFSGSAISQGSFKYDTAAAAGQATYAGTVTFHSFKVGSVLSALSAEGTTGVNETMIESSLNVYPNPATGVLNVSFEATTGADVTLSGVVGNTVYSTTAAAGENNITFNTSNLPSGVYILNVATENGRVARKVTVK